MDTYIVRLTEEQIKLLRKVVGEEALLVKTYPLPKDGDLWQKLCEVDKVLHSVAQCF